MSILKCEYSVNWLITAIIVHKKVTAKLERLDSSSDVVRLIIDAPGVEVIYRTIQEDKVKLELIFDKRSGFFRLMVDYYTRISCESTDTVS